MRTKNLKSKNAFCGLMLGDSRPQAEPLTLSLFTRERLWNKLCHSKMVRTTIGSAVVLAVWGRLD